MTKLLVHVRYTLHVNSDDESLARDYEFVKRKEMEYDSSLSVRDRAAKIGEAMQSIERQATNYILKEGSNLGEPLLCRECSKLATAFCVGRLVESSNIERSTAQQARELSIEQDIGIPICTGGQDSPCFIKAKQRIRIQSINDMGREAYHRKIAGMPCLNCGKKEPDGVRFPACNRCSVAFYCSKECQVDGWHKGHKKACRPIGETRAEYEK